MKIVIVGPGAIGLLLYSLLTLKSKEEIVLLDKDEERARRLTKNGIKVEGISSIKVANPDVSSDPKSVVGANLLIICVKSYDTKNVLKKIASVVTPQTLVLSLQNGVGNVELLSEAFGRERVLVGVTSMGATLLGEGNVRYAGEGETIIGRLDGNLGPELRTIRELFQRSKLAVKLSRDPIGVLWSKLIINVGINALSAITRLKNGKLIQFEGTRRILSDAVTEAVKVAKRKRIKLIYDDMLARVESVCEATADNVSSMLADVLNKKKTEIDFLNGAIVRQGESLGIKTPVNALLVDLVKTIESSYPLEVS